MPEERICGNSAPPRHPDAEKEGRRGLVLTCKKELIHYYGKFGFLNEGISVSVHGNVVWYQMRFTF